MTYENIHCYSMWAQKAITYDVSIHDFLQIIQPKYVNLLKHYVS